MRGIVLGGRYRLDEPVSAGHPGDEWRCTDLALDRTVTAILLPARPPDDPEFVDRVRVGWAGELAMIDHPAVPRIQGTGADPVAGPYVIVQYVESELLKHILDRTGRLSPTGTMDLVAQAADALSAVHGSGQVHGELTPLSLTVGPDGTIGLSLFGLRRRASGLDLIAGLGQAAANFVAPEQLQGGPATHQSDLFSLGVIAYQCLAGRRPFDSNSALEVAVMVVRDAPPPLPADVPAPVRSIVERAMAKDPLDRWPTATALATAARSVR